jgi:sialic acid synthase SpsE
VKGDRSVRLFRALVAPREQHFLVGIACPILVCSLNWVERHGMASKGPIIDLRGRVIGSEFPPLVIAELGINHGGNLAVAKEMVSMAAKAGAECVKHQTHFVDDEMISEAKLIKPPNANQSIWDVIASCALSAADEHALKLHAESLGLLYLSTPFSRSAANFLNELNVPAFKIGSGECDNLPLIRHIARFGKPVILSTGMQTIDSIQPSVQLLRDAKVPYALLECTNHYPSPPHCVSLRGVSDLKAAFPDAVVGFSDHSIGPTMALASVALGASIIERHFTDDRYRPGPDVTCSMDPAELRFLVDRSREVHRAVSNPKQRSLPEEAVYRFARGSVVADRDLAEGTVLCESDIWTRRPGTGEIPADQFDRLLGRRLKKALPKNVQLRWVDLEEPPNA